MKKFTGKNNIFWDFDGVLMDSMPVRNKGFELVLKEFPKEQVAQLMEFHSKNGGLSRYVKFRYFFENIRNETVTNQEIDIWASKFSEIMKSELVNPRLLILDSINFVKKSYKKFEMHIVSGSDQEELRYLCASMGISQYFKSIHGSPTPKIELVHNLLTENNYDAQETVLIGDSGNDYDAALNNNIDFFAYNNPGLKELKVNYIESFY